MQIRGYDPSTPFTVNIRFKRSNICKVPDTEGERFGLGIQKLTQTSFLASGRSLEQRNYTPNVAHCLFPPFKLYFIVYAITVVPIFPPFSPFTHPTTPSGNPHIVVHIHGSCGYLCSSANPFPIFQPVPTSSLSSYSCQSMLLCL